ncbi:type II toxin-antitoxin system ParD family antitoxin [Rhizobium sp. CG5]|uniref:type II toxin-antitoxin system ParD family antitoxin n=1 Tax=Rhizobium sp. CG5 TaxID=2726076 RepID=UPI0020347DF2|nr:type II toxin-antitoxin system ParD family antitoxin [Rhizobium sp. CG5]MCM2473993.1 type II toxin-antitoxin system ParD family antitoxin [Rhizobium sp. CG5]
MTDIHLNDRDKAFIDEQIEAGIYKDADEAVAAGLRLLGSNEGKLAELQRLIQEGYDDVEAGRVMEFASGEELTAYILKMAEERRNATAPSHNVPKSA